MYSDLVRSTTEADAGVAVVVEDLRRSFGSTKALDGVSMSIPCGTVLAVLGPNGAGKTTLLRILATLLPAGGGRAVVAGHDVAREPYAVRAHIGLTGQFAAVDEQLTGRENLRLVGRLSHLGERLVRLTEAAGRPVRTYSGGMRRRVDIAAGLVAAPSVLFLDEPTTGLDPRGRLDVWALIAELVGHGTTLLLTTQYLEEADRLADSIAVLDRGRVVAEGTPEELKRRVGGEVLEVRLADPAAVPEALRAARDLAAGDTRLHGDCLSIPVAAASGTVVRAVRVLDAAGVEVADIALRRPTLDDVFLSLTARPASKEAA